MAGAQPMSASFSLPSAIYSYTCDHPTVPHATATSTSLYPVGSRGQLQPSCPPASSNQQNVSVQNTCKDVNTWKYSTGGDVKLIALSREGHVDSALDALFVAVHGEQVSLSSVEIAGHCLLSTCERRKSLHQAQQLHVHLSSHGLDIISSLGEHLVFTYFKCGSFRHGFRVFHILPHRTTFSWTALINAYLDHSDGLTALDAYKLMQEEGVQPTKVTFLSLFKACGNVLDPEDGRALHDDAQRIGLDLDPQIGSALVTMYRKCGDVTAAEDVFHSIEDPDVVSWSALLSPYLEQGQSEKVLLLYRQMHEEGLSPDIRLIMIALQACGDLAEKEAAVLVQGHSIKVMSLEIGKSLHADARKVSGTLDLFVSSTLISMYTKCGNITGAKSVFDRLSTRDAVVWTLMLSAYVEQGQAVEALMLHRKMHEEGVNPDDQTFGISLQACSILADLQTVEDGRCYKSKALEIGKALHMDAQRMGFLGVDFVGSTLVTMYRKCGNMGKAELVFDELQSKGIFVWNAMLSAYVDHAAGNKALCLFRQLQDEGVALNEATYVTALHACGMSIEKEQGSLASKSSMKKSMWLEVGEAIHVDVLMEGFHLSAPIASTLISMYSKSGKVIEAEGVFKRMWVRSVVSWNAMISAYVENGQPENALKLYQQMRERQVLLDDLTLGCVLQAGSDIGNIEICKEIHFIITSNINDVSLLLDTTLIHAYGSCCSMADSLAIFQKVPQQDAVSWNALISGYARGGNIIGTLDAFEEMLRLGVKPNVLTYLPVLSACRHAGLVDKGVAYFESMSRDHSLTPKIEHYSSVLDLLIRAGDLSKVVDMFSRMPMEPDLPMWICLLDACQKCSNIELGRYAFNNAVRIQPKEPAPYIVMSNMYSEVNMHKLAAEVDNIRLQNLKSALSKQ